ALLNGNTSFLGTDLASIPWLGQKVTKRYARSPWYYVTDFGWPDRFQLNQDLFRLRPDKAVSDAVVAELNELTPKLNRAAECPYDQLKKAVVRIAQSMPADATAREDAVKEIQRRFEESNRWSTPFDVYGDWRRLIQYMTDFQPDYADSLFATLGRSKRANLG